MKILLVGGGTGGHITPLQAVAHEIKQIDSSIEIIGICEKDAKFLNLFKNDPSFDGVYQVRAGKYRRYAGLSKLQKILNVSTFAKNVRDVGRVCKGYVEARKLLKKLKPNGILIKGGFVGVPVGLAAAHLNIPFITHDSDSVPGLANRIISKWAKLNVTGMPTEFYDYPKSKMVYTGIPIVSKYEFISPDLKEKYRMDIGLSGCSKIITVIGASQGAGQLNIDILAIAGRLMQNHHDLGIVHIAGTEHEAGVIKSYQKELLSDELRRVVVRGFVSDAYKYTGSADVVISRASATVIAELAVQGLATILVPGQLAGDHQLSNARHLSEANLALYVAHADREGLYSSINDLLTNNERRNNLAISLNKLAKPKASKDLAELLVNEFSNKEVKNV